MDRGGRQQISKVIQVSFKRPNTGLLCQQLESTWRCHTYYDHLTRGSVDVYLSFHLETLARADLFEAKIWTLLAPAVKDFTSNFLRPRCVRNTPAPGRSWWSWLTRIILWSQNLKAIDNKEYWVISSNSTHLRFSHFHTFSSVFFVHAGDSPGMRSSCHWEARQDQSSWKDMESVM